MVPGVLDAAKAKKLSLEFMQLSQGGFIRIFSPFDFPFIYIPIRFDSNTYTKYNYSSSSGRALCSNSVKRGGQKYFRTFPEQLSIIHCNISIGTKLYM